MTNLTLSRGANDALLSQDSQIGEAFASFIDSSLTSSARATFYNTKEELRAAEAKIHSDLMAIDRGIYGICMLLPGVSDHSVQLGIRNLLSQPTDQSGLLTADDEKKLIRSRVESLPPQRMLNLFIGLKESKVNNSRTSRIILESILNSAKLELWSVKYRSKMRMSLAHAWGQRQSSIIVSILGKSAESWSAKEKGIVSRNVDRYLKSKRNKDKIYQCIRFVFKSEEDLNLPMLKSYVDAKLKIDVGKVLPYEVLEGIRSVYHPEFKNEDVLKLTKSNLTDGQKIALQRKADEANVKVEFKPERYDTVRLYLYAYEMGMTDEIRKVLSDKAEEATFLFNLEDKKAGILVDCSQSMRGSDTQKLRPMATALAVRDVLVKAAKQSVIVYAGESEVDQYDMVIPAGSTSLAEGLIDLMMQQPDVIFILSDGYENSPSGRINEVIEKAKKIGMEIPIIQYSPVMASEAGGVRKLSSAIKSLPIASPESSAVGLLKEAFSSDLKSGFKMLTKIVRPALEKAQIRNDYLIGEAR
jgi:hypothetical protein